MMRMSFRRGHKGFTLVELAVVMAILGVLAAVAVPMLSQYIGSSQKRAWETDQAAIQQAVDAYYTDPGNVRYSGMRQYPIIGKGQTADTLTLKTTATTYKDDGAPIAAGNRNLLGGTQGADLATTPVWTDDSDKLRTVSATSLDTWGTVPITYLTNTYHVDSRYYFIDFSLLTNYMKAIPGSAAKDNTTATPNTLTGSYIWYIDNKGTVQSLHYYLPSQTGFQTGVYP